jgi:hypothetical protein
MSVVFKVIMKETSLNLKNSKNIFEFLENSKDLVRDLPYLSDW